MGDNIWLKRTSNKEREGGLANNYTTNNNYNYAAAAAIISEDESSSSAAGLIKEQDRLLPIANVGRIMKQILPSNAKISKEAKETMQECVSEFISFVTGEASDKCHKEKRKTVNGDDVCWAMGSLGFDDYSDPLKRYLVRYREAEGERANQNKAASASADEFESNGRDHAETNLGFDFMGNRRI